MSVSLFRAQRLARELIAQGVDTDVAIGSGSYVHGARVSLVRKYVELALAGLRTRAPSLRAKPDQRGRAGAFADAPREPINSTKENRTMDITHVFSDGTVVVYDDSDSTDARAAAERARRADSATRRVYREDAAAPPDPGPRAALLRELHDFHRLDRRNDLEDAEQLLRMHADSPRTRLIAWSRDAWRGAA